MVSDFIENNFVITEGEGIKVISWEDKVYTNYDDFAGILFGEVISKGMEEGKSNVEILRSMIEESVTKNYGFTELIIRRTGVLLF